MSQTQTIIAETIYVFTSILKFLVFARVLLSWFPRYSSGGSGGVIGKIIAVVNAMTEPILGPLRHILNESPIGGLNTVIDFSSIFAYFLIDGFSALVVGILLAF